LRFRRRKRTRGGLKLRTKMGKREEQRPVRPNVVSNKILLGFKVHRLIIQLQIEINSYLDNIICVLSNLVG